MQSMHGERKQPRISYYSAPTWPATGRNTLKLASRSVQTTWEATEIPRGDTAAWIRPWINYTQNRHPDVELLIPAHYTKPYQYCKSLLLRWLLSNDIVKFCISQMQHVYAYDIKYHVFISLLIKCLLENKIISLHSLI